MLPATLLAAILLSLPAGQNGTGVCSSSTAQLRSRCRSIGYCSTHCQKTDWASHKLLCPQYLLDNERPSPFHRQAILFPDTTKEPKFVWIECKEMAEGSHVWEEPQNVKDYLGPSFIERTYFHHNKVRGRALKNSIEIHIRSDFSVDGSVLNQSIVAATRGEAMHEWCGPAVALRKSGNCMAYMGLFGDMDMEDYLHVVDHFRAYC